MTAKQEFFITTGVVIFILIMTYVFSVAIPNADERAKCESLRAQNVKAYVAEGLVRDKCVVLQRDVVHP